ncbi:CDP-glucose 4,6-dehydratase [alpha proteobacterium BAL199]|nr:CDP-glucose 4,6-dehydratase [alpha proteobacterium BAL199]
MGRRPSPLADLAVVAMVSSVSIGLPDRKRWNGRRVLLTGNTGFKGSWLTIWLNRLGADLLGLAQPPSLTPNLFDDARLGELIETRLVDLRDRDAVIDAVSAAKPEIVLHLAAQSLVGRAFAQPIETFDVNTTGTLNLLEAIRQTGSVRVVVVVTSDKVYRESSGREVFTEESPLGGAEPYGASKAAAELVTSAYRDAFLAPKGVAIATARAGNVIGGGDWAENRLLPDIVRAWSRDRPLLVRNPSAVRPWQHVLEPLAGYLVLAERLLDDPTFATAWNFGPDPRSTAEVRQVIEIAREAFGRGTVELGPVADGYHEAAFLAVESGRAQTRLGFENRWGLREAVERTIAWYKNQLTGADARIMCATDLDAYERAGGSPP